MRENKTKVGGFDVFGQLPVKSCKDRLADGRSVLQDVVVPDAQDGIALCTHEIVAAAIMWAVGVLGAVDFDDEPLVATTEIREVGTDRELSREFVAAELSPFQFEPKRGFGLIAAGA